MGYICSGKFIKFEFRILNSDTTFIKELSKYNNSIMSQIRREYKYFWYKDDDRQYINIYELDNVILVKKTEINL